MRCIDTTKTGRCKSDATTKIEKNDSSSRVAYYCDKHAKPFLAYPLDFKATKIVKVN